MTTSAETWAFCGVHPDAPNAAKAVHTLASSAGIDATFGPCMPPDWATYTAAEPGARYVDPETYFRLTVMNAGEGMKTIVYDARLWSSDPAVRQAAIAFWLPHVAWVRAFDMGDEFDPSTPDWAVLITRWRTMLDVVTPATGVGPFTNHLGFSAVLAQALIDMPEHRAHLSFDNYDEPTALALAAEFDGQVNHLMCAVNALRHGQLVPTATKITRHMKNLRAAGADSFLIFGGATPYSENLTPDPTFGNTSLVNRIGGPTAWSNAVLRGAQS
ncbi:MAG: hypothetical protein QOE00_2037 [Ilumatobacteraceae bacterium]